MSIMNKLLKILLAHGDEIGLKVNFKKIKSLMLGISEDEKMMFENENINQVDGLTHFGTIISKDMGCSKDARSRIAKVQGVWYSCKKFGAIRR